MNNKSNKTEIITRDMSDGQQTGYEFVIIDFGDDPITVTKGNQPEDFHRLLEEQQLI